jgi:hypothetical protein
MKKSASLLFSVLTLLTTNVFAHGEDKAGPHGGYIRMPGAFHTEVVKEKSGYRVYLLDINWKNPSVLDSAVSANIQVEKKNTELTCAKESDSYFCKSTLPQKGELNITAKREGQTGGIAVYKLPLKFENTQNEMSEHKGH